MGTTDTETRRWNLTPFASPSTDDQSPTLDALARYADDVSGDTVLFYEAEGRLLSLWDRLQKLRLESAIRESQMAPKDGDFPLRPPLPDSTPTHADVEPALSVTDSALELAEAERECVEARAAYLLKQSVMTDLLIAPPILKAMHAGVQATPTERTLTPLIYRRDILAIVFANLTAHLRSLQTSISQIESLYNSAADQNRGLAVSATSLSSRIESEKERVRHMERFRARLTGTEDEVKVAREKRRILKSVLASIIAGSGVDWTREEDLTNLVLDDEDEEED